MEPIEVLRVSFLFFFKHLSLLSINSLIKLLIVHPFIDLPCDVIKKSAEENCKNKKRSCTQPKSAAAGISVVFITF